MVLTAWRGDLTSSLSCSWGNKRLEEFSQAAPRRRRELRLSLKAAQRETSMLSRARACEGTVLQTGDRVLGLRSTGELLLKSNLLVCLEGLVTMTRLLNWWLLSMLGTVTSQQHLMNVERDYLYGFFCNLG